jgi:hypothetical protein
VDGWDWGEEGVPDYEPSDEYGLWGDDAPPGAYDLPPEHELRAAVYEHKRLAPRRAHRDRRWREQLRQAEAAADALNDYGTGLTYEDARRAMPVIEPESDEWFDTWDEAEAALAAMAALVAELVAAVDSLLALQEADEPTSLTAVPCWEHSDRAPPVPVPIRLHTDLSPPPRPRPRSVGEDLAA